jgi:hypothetical protein
MEGLAGRGISDKKGLRELVTKVAHLDVGSVRAAPVHYSLGISRKRNSCSRSLSPTVSWSN